MADSCMLPATPPEKSSSSGKIEEQQLVQKRLVSILVLSSHFCFYTISYQLFLFCLGLNLGYRRTLYSEMCHVARSF